MIQKDKTGSIPLQGIFVTVREYPRSLDHFKIDTDRQDTDRQDTDRQDSDRQDTDRLLPLSGPTCA